MLFLFTVTEWGRVIYLEETASNAPPPPEKNSDGRSKNQGFYLLKDALKLFKFNDTLQTCQ